jgi:hypothetical protein
MISIIIAVAIVAGVGWIAWRRWSDWRTPTAPLPIAVIPPETLALEAFTHGNTCLAAGQLAEATAAFERARTLDPKRLHVAARLAEVERRQSAVPATAPASASS